MAYDAKQKKELKEKIIYEIANNLRGRVLASEAAGVDYNTFKRWYDESADFADAVKRAEEAFEAKGKNVAIASIFKAMPKSWQAGAWWLERKFSNEFKNKTFQEGTETVALDLSEKAKELLKPFFNDNNNTGKNRAPRV